MKIFVFIFAFYTVVLSLTPCCDRYEQANIPQTIQQSQDHHQDDNEFCSPFCQCSCCHGFIVLHRVKYYSINPVFADKQFALPLDHLPSGFAVDFWQPPRLG